MLALCFVCIMPLVYLLYPSREDVETRFEHSIFAPHFAHCLITIYILLNPNRSMEISKQKNQDRRRSSIISQQLSVEKVQGGLESYSNQLVILKRAKFWCYILAAFFSGGPT